MLLVSNAQAAQLLGCDANTIRLRTERNKRYRPVAGSTRPAKIYAQEVYEERAQVLERLNAIDRGDERAADLPPGSSNTAASSPTVQSLLEEIDRLRIELGNARESAKVLLLTDSAKNDLIRQYLYDHQIVRPGDAPS